MSTEEAVAANPPADQNAQAAEDAKNLLAELKGENGEETKETNGATNGDKKAEDDGETKTETVQPERKERSDRRDNRDNKDSGRGGRGGGRGGRGGHRNFKENIKSDLTSQEVSDDPVAIRKQVEFYFSDSNLPMDKFLLGKVGGSKNNPVELSILHSFKRMRHFQPFEAIVEALKESTFLELTDDNTCVRRKEPLPESLDEGFDPNTVRVFEDKAMPRSVYVKGFGQEVPSTQFDIEAFFAPYGPTNAIRLRRSDTKLFKGSVFVEFESEELAKKFLELEPKPKYQGTELQIMSKKEYCDKKVDDIKSGKIKANNQRGPPRRDDRRGGGRDFKRKRDDEDNRDWRERRDEDRKNGFKDDKRRGGRDSRDSRDSRDKGRREFKEKPVEKDNRGIPTVQASTESDDKPKKNTGKEDALAKARAAVEAENKKTGQESADNVEAADQQGKTNVKTDVAGTVADSIKEDVEAVGKKRSREDDGEEAEREAKKVDVKA